MKLKLDAAEELLRETVERGVGRDVAALDRRPFPGLTSYRVDVVTAELEDGDAVEIFLKDYGESRLPKDAAAARRERERRVYQELLDAPALGTTRFYGARWDAEASRFWLLLEFVQGEQLRYCTYEHWPAAAAWLGRLHGYFRDQQERLCACHFLVRHDAGFFVGAAERALQTLGDFSATLARRLAAVLENYDAVLAVLARDPATLVHGSYRPQNVLVDRRANPVRICPTDWELAAFGSSTFDLAFICDGFDAPRLDDLLDVYEATAVGYGLPSRDRQELRHELDCFRLHKTVNSLAHLRNWPHPTETATKVVGTVEAIAAALA